jgi:short-subunit dehydrogenase
MTAFSEGLYLELKSIDSSVRVQALCPGFTYSEFHDILHVDRNSVAPSFMWLRAEFLVDESLQAYASGKLFVVPGWRYRLLVALVTKLPASLRIALEAGRSRKRPRRR